MTELAVCHAAEPISIGRLERYAASYSPCKRAHEFCMELPRTPDAVVAVLQDHPKDDAYKRHVTLVLLKLYHGQLKNHRQSYEIRRGPEPKPTPDSTDPLIAAFASFSGVSVKGEFVSSDLAYRWVVSQPDLLRDRRIAAAVKRIRAQEDKLSRRR